MHNDSAFLRKVGIEPCVLDDPIPKRPSSREPEGPEIPPVTEHDEKWLSSCGVTREPEPEPRFQPPASSLEYLEKYPDRIVETVREVARTC
jgi:hypothetical protein